MSGPVVTLLFTDLVGSSDLLARLGDEASERLRRAHFRLLRESVAERGGEEVKNLGDGLMVVFDSAVRAVECAVDMQRAIARYNAQGNGEELSVRVGVHVGEPIRDEDDYFGTPVVVAKRLCDQAAGGEILVSDLVRALVAGRVATGFEGPRTVSLKGIPDPVTVYDACWNRAASSGNGRSASPDPRGLRFVGRAPELDRLEHDLDEAIVSGLRAVLVVGDPGMGKTRLINELVTRRRDDALALTARAYPLGTTASLGLWVEALEGYLRTLDADHIRELCGAYVDDLAALLPSVAAVQGAGVADPPRVRLLGGLAYLLSTMSRRTPLIIVLDDVHLADGSSWEAFSYLARNLGESPILLVLVARAIELSEEHMGSEVVLALEQEGLLRRQPISTLDRPEMAELAQAFLEREPPRALVEWLAGRSQGSPLFALGLLRTLVDEGGDLDAPVLNSLPEDLSDRVTARLKTLQPSERATLEIIAVVGARVELSELVELAGRPLDDLAETLDVLVRQRFVSEDDRGRELWYEIHHPLIQEAIYASISGARRRALHRFVARTLVKGGRLGPAAAHFVQSASVGDDEAIAGLCDALRQAEARGHHREALTIMEALLEIVPAGDRRWLVVFDAMAPQAEWIVDHRTDTHWETGIAVMRRIEQLLDRGGAADDRRATLKFNLGTFLVWGPADVEAGRPLIEEARTLYEKAGDTRAALLATNELGYCTAIAGDSHAHRAIAADVLVKGTEAGDRLVMLQAHCSLAHAETWLGDITAAAEDARAGGALAQADGRVYRQSYLLSHGAVLAAFAGRMTDAQLALDTGREVNPEYRDTLLSEFAAIVAWLRGDFSRASDLMREVVAWDGGHASVRRVFGLSFAGFSELEMGNLAEAARIAAISLEVFHGRDWWVHSEAARWHAAAVVAAQGNVDGAIDRMVEIMESLEAAGSYVYESFIVADLAELGLEARRPEVIEAAAALVPDMAVPPSTTPLQQLKPMALATAALAREQHDDAARLLCVAADAFADAGWRPMEGRARMLLGRALAPVDRDAALAELGTAVDIFESCGARPRLQAALTALDALGTKGQRARTAAAGPGRLTRREREVASLAVAGLSAREIAGRLFIGERTVETHLAHTYAKLGVPNRTELIRRAADFDLAVPPV